MATIQIPIRLSGDIVVAEDAVARELHELTVGIEPVQDLHGYDHPWPVGGGKNLFDVDSTTITKNIIINSSGVEAANNYYSSTSAITLSPSTTYTFSGQTNNSSGYIVVTQYDSNNSLLHYDSQQVSGTLCVLTLTTESTCNYVRLSLAKTSKNADALFDTVQIELGSSATAWTPYSNVCPISGHTETNIYREAEYDADADPTITIDLDGTRYSGTLNVLTGEMTVDRGIFNLGSPTPTTQATGTTHKSIKIPTGTVIYDPNALKTKFIAEKYQVVQKINSATLLNSPDSRDIGIYIYRNNSGAGAANFYAVIDLTDTVSGNLVYPLATPLTVQLLPSTLSMLQGTNTVWNDTGDTTLIYYRSIDMSLTQMYPAMPGSPKTSLAEGISAVATSMTLDDASVLPSAPNICVIGADSDAEVVSYSSIVGNVVSGLVRGLGGTTASAWASNTMVARNFTSLDHNTFILNITDLDTRKADLASPALTGTPTAPTPALNTDSTQIATTAFVQDHAPIHLSVTASAGSAITKSDARITSSMRVINIVLGTPSNVANNVTWTTSDGSATFNATFTGSTTIDFDLVETN